MMNTRMEKSGERKETVGEKSGERNVGKIKKERLGEEWSRKERRKKEWDAKREVREVKSNESIQENKEKQESKIER